MFTQIIAATTLADFTPQIAGIAAVASLLGWILKGALTKSQPVKASITKDVPTKDRSKALEAALDKSKAAHKYAKSELAALQESSVSGTKFAEIQATLGTAEKSLEAEGKRAALLETDLKKAQDTIKVLNSRTNDADKAQKERSFALENELSKTRQQLAIFEARPNDTAELLAEIDRLKESVATTTRYAGDLRKREAAAQEALSKAQAKDSSHPAAAQNAAVALTTPTPVGDSDRVAAAKAEVLRLLEQNKQIAPMEESLQSVSLTSDTVFSAIPPDEIAADAREIMEPVPS